MPIVRRASLVLALALAAALSGCEDPAITGVVQETNQPCTDDDCACTRDHAYVRMVTRTCTNMEARLYVCSDEPVCDAVLDELAAAVTACSEPASPFPIDLAACP